MDLYKKYFLGFFITIAVVFSVGVYINGRIDAADLRKNPKFTVATIENFGLMKGHRTADYVYTCNEVPYHSWGYTSAAGVFNECLETRACVGLKFLLAYSSKNPENHKIFFDKQVFSDTVPSSMSLPKLDE